MKELSQLQVLTLAKSALEAKADNLASHYGNYADMTKRDIINKIRTCFDEIDWIDSEIERIRKENPRPPRIE